MFVKAQEKPQNEIKKSNFKQIICIRIQGLGYDIHDWVKYLL